VRDDRDDDSIEKRAVEETHSGSLNGVSKGRAKAAWGTAREMTRELPAISCGSEAGLRKNIFFTSLEKGAN
jgi:hypothetical protein